MDSVLQDIIRPQRGRIISFYCPEDIYNDLDSLVKLVGRNKRSAIISLCLVRLLPTLRQQLLQPHIKPSKQRSTKDRLRALAARKTQQNASP